MTQELDGALHTIRGFADSISCMAEASDNHCAGLLADEIIARIDAILAAVPPETDATLDAFNYIRQDKARDKKIVALLDQITKEPE